MPSIPVIGTAIVNGVHWLHRLIESVDFKVDNFLVINNNGRNQITNQLNSLVGLNKQYIKNIHICHMPTNLGCAASWNLIIKLYMNNPYWVITNHDVAFTPGFLESMYTKAVAGNNIGMVHGSSGEFGIGTWDIFLIKDWVIKKYGLFDENFYPAYCEDWDYLMRMVHDPIDKDFVNLPYYHGETFEYSKSGSQTWREDADLKYKIDYGRYLNETEYMTKKWGVNWIRNNPYKYPFDKPENSIDYNLDFIRSKYLGF